MHNNNLSFFKSTFKQGVFMGVGFCLYTTIMWLTKLDTTYLNFGQYLDMAIILLPILIILWAIHQESKAYSITFFQRVGVAVFIGAISFIIYDPFLYLYHHYINPEWFNSVLSLKEIELRTSHASQNQIFETLEKMKASNVAQSGLFRMSALIPFAVVIPFIIALLSLIFIRSKKLAEG